MRCAILNAAALSAVLAVMACTGGQIDPTKTVALGQKATAAIQSADPVIGAACQVVANLDGGFQAVVAAGKVDATGQTYEKSVMQIHDALCTGGPPGDVADALARLWYAAGAITGVTPGAATATPGKTPPSASPT